MAPLQISEEYQFLRDKIEKIAHLVVNDCPSEATFMLGCLHSVCHNHHLEWLKIHHLNHEDKGGNEHS